MLYLEAVSYLLTGFFVCFETVEFFSGRQYHRSFFHACIQLLLIIRDHSVPRQIFPNSAGQFCQIPRLTAANFPHVAYFKTLILLTLGHL